MSSENRKKTVLIVGGASGIERATVEALLGEEYCLIVVDKDSERLTSFKADLINSGRDDCLFLQMDLANRINVLETPGKTVRSSGALEDQKNLRLSPRLRIQGTGY